MSKIPEEKPMLLGDAGDVKDGKESAGSILNFMNTKSTTKNCSETRALLPQILVVGGSYLISLSCGVSQGHSAVLLPQLEANNSSIHVDSEMASWIASVHVAINPVGSILGGLLMDRYGRRKTVIFGTLPYILGWILIATAQNHVMILAGRCLDGIAKGTVTAPRMVHLDELADPRYRGMLSSTVSISFVLGILLIYLLGGFLDWRIASWWAALFPLLGLLAFLWLPESPIWLVRHKREQEAAVVLKWIWGPGKETKAQEELQDMVSRFSCRYHPNLPRIEESTATCGIHWWKTFLVPHNLKPFLIIHIFNLFQVLCGTQLTIFYAIDILSNINKDHENSQAFLTGILTAVIRLVFVILLCFLIHCIDRRPLAISSGVGSTISTLVLGTMLYIQNTWSNPLFTLETERWVALGLVLVYIGASTCGFFSLPFIMAGEVIPTMSRGIMCGYIFAVNDLALFGVVKSYPWLSQAIGSYGVFWIFGVSCLLCTIFVYLFLPETQGKSLMAIEDYFRQGNTLWFMRMKKENSVRLKDSKTQFRKYF